MFVVPFHKKVMTKEKQFIQMIEEDKEQLYRIAFSYMKNEHDALEVVQETVCKAYENLSKLREIDYMKTWFTRILINTALQMIRQRNRIQLDDFTGQNLADHVDDVSQMENRLDLMQSLDTLGDQEKMVVILRYFEDYKLEEVSQAVELPLNTTKSILYRALKKMKINFEEEV